MDRKVSLKLDHVFIKVHPREGHEDQEGVLTSALDKGGRQRHVPAALPLGERPGTHCTGGWVVPRAGLDRCGKSRPHRDSIPRPTVRSESPYRLRYPGLATYTHTPTRTHTHTPPTHTHPHAHTHTHTHTPTHTHTHPPTHKHTHPPTPPHAPT